MYSISIYFHVFPHEGGALPPQAPQTLSSDSVVKIERHSALGWVQQRQGVQTQVVLQDDHGGPVT